MPPINTIAKQKSPKRYKYPALLALSGDVTLSVAEPARPMPLTLLIPRIPALRTRIRRPYRTLTPTIVTPEPRRREGGMDGPVTVP
ncbi:hypothetical protein GCM10017559_19990 [Streptosporangium longisporum]|uniref:Uncharacterized protein n=1 Tax=Streptosporangium longisporum TaxID=46187 RepID=A0ABN3XXN0_9ACTN